MDEDIQDGFDLRDEVSLNIRIERENARLQREALARLTRAMKIYASELVTIGDLTVRKP